MGFFDRLKEKKRQEKERQLKEQQNEWNKKADYYFELIVKERDVESVTKEMRLDSLIEGKYQMINGRMHYYGGLSEQERYIFTYIYKKYFGEVGNRLDDDFAEDFIGHFHYNFHGEQGLNPIDLKNILALEWAKEYLKENQNEIIYGELVYRAQIEYLLLEEERSYISSLGIGRDVLEGPDLLGETEMKKLIFSPGLFEIEDRAKLRYILYLYKYLSDPIRCTELIDSINDERLAEEFPAFKKQIMRKEDLTKLKELIFFDQTNNHLRQPNYIVNTIEYIFNYNFKRVGPNVFHE